MAEKKRKVSRRGFIQSAGAAGLGLLAGSTGVQAKEPLSQVPVRPLGKTGVQVSQLSLGGMFDIPNNQIVLKQALAMGVTYWDTAFIYEGGRSEEGIGKFFKRNPDARKKVFLVSKSVEWDPRGMTRSLDKSLSRLKTDYVDLVFVHGIGSVDDLEKGTRTWAENAKKSGKIRFFGFSTHRNMEECLAQAPGLGYIDVIMMTYNFRIMHKKAMDRAVEACHQAGIGLVAMKTQGGGPVKDNTPREMELAGRFLKKGFTPEQAKLMAVWQDPRIAAICSQMPNTTILRANAQAAADSASFSRADRNALREYAHATAGGYCAGCARLCEGAVVGALPVADLMRGLMYEKNYQNKMRAPSLLAGLPQSQLKEMARADYQEAERRCPHGLPIAGLVKKALKLA